MCAMVRHHHLATSRHDASGRAFLAILANLTEQAARKATRAGHVVMRVPARFTTQTGRGCGQYVQKSLSVRTHR